MVWIEVIPLASSIGSLRSVAEALGVSMADLFAEDQQPKPQAVRFEKHPRLASEPGARKYLITQRPLRNLEIYGGEFDPGSSTGDEPYTHGDSQEVFIVTAGEVVLTLDDATYVLRAGDSIEFRSSTPHHVRNDGTEVAGVLWICSPVSGVG